MKNKILLIFCLIISIGLTNTTQASCPLKKEAEIKCNRYSDCPNSAMDYKRYMNRLQSERQTVYNALNLSDEQIQMHEQMMEEKAPFYEQKFNELVKESYKLKSLECASAPDNEINCQKRLVKKIKDSIEKSLDKDNKAFRKCLTQQQRAKYSMIKKLERDDYKKAAHQKDYYKSNPQMRCFGNP